MGADRFGPRSQVAKIAGAHHGALDYHELERSAIDPGEVLDFSSNINPYAPPPDVLQVAHQLDFSPYPDRDAIQLRRVIGERFRLDPDQIVVGNGAAELIWLTLFTFCAPGGRVLVLGPTFGEYERCAALMGAEIHKQDAVETEGFQPDTDKIERSLRGLRPRLFIACSPNNPTGVILPPASVLRWAERYPGTGFIIDEAYLPFTPRFDSLMGSPAPNLLVLRSLTKDFGLAGLRLGFAAGPRDLITAVANVRPAWNVNAVAQAAGVAALQAPHFFEDSLQQLAEDKINLLAGLRAAGYAPLPSAAHYFLMHVGDAKVFRQRLLAEYSIQVRDCASFGLPAYVRIATRTPEDNARLIEACRDLRNVT